MLVSYYHLTIRFISCSIQIVVHMYIHTYRQDVHIFSKVFPSTTFLGYFKQTLISCLLWTFFGSLLFVEKRLYWAYLFVQLSAGLHIWLVQYLLDCLDVCTLLASFMLTMSISIRLTMIIMTMTVILVLWPSA